MRPLALALAALAAGCSSPESFAEQTAEQPNIVFILVDDMGWGDVGYHGSEIATPNIDALASRGVVLDRAYAYPVCSPTRAALLTGRNPLRFGVDGPLENDAMLPEQLTLLPQLFQQAGYKTWMVGKWHLGMNQIKAMPHSRGFDYFYGHLGGFIDFYTHVYFGGLDWQRNGSSLREDGYSTDLLTTDALRLLNEYDGGAPFFLYLSYNSPHTPLQYPPSAPRDYQEIANPDRRVYAQMTSDVDTAIGKVLAALESLSLSESTLVVFMSDNGGNLEAGAGNADLRAGKASAHEGGVRVPAIAAWPGVLEGCRTTEHPVFTQDWAPTLLDAAGASYEQSSFDGRSAWQALVGNSASHERPPIVIGARAARAVYKWPHKLVRNPTGDQLFDVVTDPREANNLAEQKPALVKELADVLDRMPKIESKAARGPRPETLFRDERGAFVYDIRKPETQEPWAEEAIGSAAPPGHRE